MRRWVGLIATLIAFEAVAVEQRGEAWILAVAQGRASSLVRWYAEVQPRTAFNAGESVRLLVRPAVGFQLTPQVSLWAGYGWTPVLVPTFVNEHRAFEQLLLEHRLGPWMLVNRTRFEQRFVEGSGGVSLRLRHMVRALVRFGEASPLGVAMYDEPFFGLNDLGAGPVAGFDQNRAFLGLNYKLDPLFQVELGYLNTLSRRRAQDTLMGHTVLLFLLADFPERNRAAD